MQPDATTSPLEIPAHVLHTRRLALGSVLGLIVLGLAWELWLAPTGSGTLALKVLPLVPAIPGLMRHRMFTYRWLALLVWLYFFEGVSRATSEAGPGMWLALIETLLAMLLFLACVLHIRLRLRNARPKLAP